MDYVFVASCHGLEILNSIVSINNNWKTIDMYCHANMQRGCIYGTITLTEDVYEELLDFIRTGDSDIALNLIKQSPYNFPVSRINKFKRIMEKIPNKELDWI